MISKIVLLFAAFLANVANAAEEPTPAPQSKVQISVDRNVQWGAVARFAEHKVKPGDNLDLEVHVQVSPLWHIYGIETEAPDQSFTRFEIKSLPKGLTVPENGHFQGPAAKVYESFGSTTKVYSGRVVFKLPVRVAANAAPGLLKVQGHIQAMACDDKNCLLPTKIDFEAALEVIGEALDITIDPIKQWGAAAKFASSEVAQGDIVSLQVHVRTAPLWHVYGMQDDAPDQYYTRFELEELPEGFGVPENANWTGPPPEDFASFGESTKVYDGDIVFEHPIAVTSAVEPGTYEIKGKVSALACSSSTCMTPGPVSFKASILVVDRGEAAADSSVESAVIVGIGPDSGEPGSKKSLLSIFVLAVLGAMLSWVMPCVYPMIPITISFFGKTAEAKHVRPGSVATAYGLGIAGTFILFGMVVGLLSLAFQGDSAQKTEFANLANTIATNGWVNLAIGILFVLFALSMFGFFEIRVPNWLLNKADSAGRGAKGAYSGSVMLGVAFALASFTCTVPVVGSLLAIAAEGSTEGLLRSVFGMAVYGAVFAAPFVVLSLLPGTLSKLPRAGGWMETVKVTFGFIEIAAAIKFLWVPDMEWNFGLLPRPVVLILFLLIGIATIAFLLGLFHVGHGTKVKPFRVGFGRVFASLVTVLFMIPVAMSLRAKPAYVVELPARIGSIFEALLPPPPTEDELAIEEGWFVDEYDGALAKARREDMPLFVDFTGVYCGNCRDMEHNVFPLKEVKERFDKMVRTRLYVDRSEPRHQRFRQMQFERYQQASQPYYVILDPTDETVLVQDGGTMTTNSFVTLLEAGLAKFRERRETAMLDAEE